MISILSELTTVFTMAWHSSIIAAALVVLCISASSAHPPSKMKPDGRIVGGNEAVPYSAPYMVSLEMHLKIYDAVIQCGGTVLSRNYVLTAKHCLRGVDRGLLSFGVHNLRKPEFHRINRKVKSSDFILHESSDIGLVKLPEPIDINVSPYIKNVTLPSRSDINASYATQRGVTYGWGYYSDRVHVLSDVLRVVEVSVSQKCTGSFGEICTEGTNGVGTCGGDSGGPLLVNGVQVGITSWGPGECEAGDWSIYVFVNKFLDWIEENTDVTIDP